MNNLKEKTINGVAWETTNSGIRFVVHFVVSIILARLLSPDDYGLIGIIVIFTSIADCITISGFFSSLIQKKNAGPDDYNTMFFSNMVSSSVLYIILFFCAPLIAGYFRRAELVELIRVQSTTLVISAFALVQRARFAKKMDFKTPAKIAFFSSIFSGIIGIVLAFCGFGVWALVLSTVASTLMITVLNCVYSRWMPNLRFSISSFKELFGYGWKVLIAELLDTIWMQLYQLVVGRRYSPETLGQYTRGKGFVDLFSTTIYNVTRTVTFSSLSQVQDDVEQTRLVFRKMIKVLIFITSIGVFGVAAVGKSMVLVLIGEQWLPCVSFLQILCFGSLLYPINATNMNLLKSQGRSDVFLILSIVRKVLEIGPILLGVFIGIKWMVWGGVVTNWIAFFLYSHFTGKQINYSGRQQFLDLLPSLGIAVVMAAPVWMMSFIDISPFVIFPMQILVEVGIVVCLCEATKREEYLEVKSIVLSTIYKLANRFKERYHE